MVRIIIKQPNAGGLKEIQYNNLYLCEAALSKYQTVLVEDIRKLKTKHNIKDNERPKVTVIHNYRLIKKYITDYIKTELMYMIKDIDENIKIKKIIIG